MNLSAENLEHGVHGLLVTMISLVVGGVVDLLTPLLVTKEVPLWVMQWTQMAVWIVGLITGVCTTFFLFYNNIKNRNGNQRNQKDQN